MSETALPALPHPRLAEFAFAPLPAWVWAPEGGRLLWANAVGAAMFGADSLVALARRELDARHPAVQQVARLAGTLPDAGVRLDRLRGFAAGVGRLLTCNCSRLELADGTKAILIAASEPAGPSLPPGERARRLLAGLEGPFAAFSPGGALLYATPQGAARPAGTATLAAAGADTLAASALERGEASGETPLGTLRLWRMGGATEPVLLATLAPALPPAVEPEPEPVPVVVSEEPVAIATAEAPAAMTESAATEPATEAPLAPVAAPDPAEATEPGAELPANERQADRGAPEAATAAAPAAEPPREAPLEERPQPPAERPQPLPERRQPLRFVWQIDADDRFTVTSPE